MTVEHATQVFAMDKLPGNEQESKQTGVPCLRFQAPVFFRGDLVAQSAEKTGSFGLGAKEPWGLASCTVFGLRATLVLPFSSTTRYI